MDKRDLNFRLNYNKDWIHWLQTGQSYEPEVLEVMLRFVRPGDKVIDAGANLGLLSLSLSQMVGPEGEVIAFEPDDRLFEQLVQNIELNGVKNVLCCRQALWETDVWMDFYSVPHGGYSSCVKFFNEPGTVEQKILYRRLDALINPECPIRLLKVDCEGADFFVLRGAEQLLRRGVDCVLMEFSPYLMAVVQVSEREIRNFMRELGYAFFLLHEDGAQPSYVPDDAPPQIAFALRSVTNVMFSTREKVAQAWT